MTNLYRSSDLVIDLFPAAERPRNSVVLIFSSLEFRRMEGNALGGETLVRQGFDVILVKSTRDDWYQRMRESELQVIDRTLAEKRYHLILAYGSSMGAFGALLFSGRFQCDHVLALSPQFRIDQPEDTRWVDHAARFAWRQSLTDRSFGAACRYTIVFDPHDADRWHAEKIAQLVPPDRLRFVKLPYSGHPVTLFLHEMDVLANFVNEHLLGVENAPPRKWRQGRGRSRRYAQAMVAAAESVGNFQRALKFISAWLQAHPGDTEFQFQRGVLLERTGGSEEHHAWLQHMANCGLRDHGILTKLAQGLLERGEVAAAQRVLLQAKLDNASDPAVHHLQSRISQVRGARRSAIEAAKTAWRLYPEHPHVGAQLASLLLADGRPAIAARVLQFLRRRHPEFTPILQLHHRVNQDLQPVERGAKLERGP